MSLWEINKKILSVVIYLEIDNSNLIFVMIEPWGSINGDEFCKL